MKSIADIICSKDLPKNIIDANRDGKKVSVFGVQTFTRAAISSRVGRALVVCSDYFTAGKFLEQLRCHIPSAVILKEKEEVLLHFSLSGKGGAMRERFTALGEIAQGRANVVVTTARALMQLYPDARAFSSGIISVRKGDCIDPIELAKRLTGYLSITPMPSANG